MAICRFPYETLDAIPIDVDGGTAAPGDRSLRRQINGFARLAQRQLGGDRRLGIHEKAAAGVVDHSGDLSIGPPGKQTEGGKDHAGPNQYTSRHLGLGKAHRILLKNLRKG